MFDELFSKYELQPHSFAQRFCDEQTFSDPFARLYKIVKDSKTGKRAVYKHYLSETAEQEEAILDNLQNYSKLSEQEEICRLLAFTRLSEPMEVLAAFEYDEYTLNEFIKTEDFESDRNAFYVTLLSEMVGIVRSMAEIQLDLDEVIHTNILVRKGDGGDWRVRVLYDEREKIYDKVFEGIKTFTSAQKLQAVLSNDESYFGHLLDKDDSISAENLFQVGLLLLDLMFQCETQGSSPQASSDSFSRDQPVLRSLTRNNQKSYYSFEDGKVLMDRDALQQKVDYLCQLPQNHFVCQITKVCLQAVESETEKRISLSQMEGQLERLWKIYHDAHKSKGSVSSRMKQSEPESNQGGVQPESVQRVNETETTQFPSKESRGNQAQERFYNSKFDKEQERTQPQAEVGQEAASQEEKPGNKYSRSYQENTSGTHVAEEVKKSVAVQNRYVSEVTQLHRQSVVVRDSNHSQNKSDQQNQGLEVSREASSAKTIPSTLTHVLTSGNAQTGVLSEQIQNRLEGPELFMPKEKLLHNVGKAHSSVQKSLELTIEEVGNRKGSASKSNPSSGNCLVVKKKEYYDNSTYYGEVDPKTNRRTGLGIYMYAEGDVYFGQWKQNTLLKGTYIFRNGESYEGTVKGGKQGYGKYRYSNGNVYEGEWKDDLKSGKGIMFYPNNDKYDGAWAKGKKNGLGTYFYNNGTVYEGNFANGRKSGHGLIRFPNGTTIEADWRQTHIEGKGKVHYPNGDYFEGEYHLSEKHGQGLYVWESDKSRYEGEFRKDCLEGDAKIQFTPKEFYHGRVKNGRREGQGVYQYENGDLFSGEWSNDLKLVGKYQFANGDQYEGRFKDNQLKFGVIRYSNGECYEGEFRDGMRHGVGTYRDSSGQTVCEGHWECDDFRTTYSEYH